MFRKTSLLLIFIAWLAFVIVVQPQSSLTGIEITLHFLFFLYFGAFAVLFRALSLSGAIAASVIGTQISAISNYSILPLILFFACGSLLSKLPTKVLSDAKSGKPRDAWQVLANGGMAFCISILGSLLRVNLESVYLVSIAVAAADTWSSELGMRFGKTPRDILSLRKMPAGLSGAVSSVGFIASVAGAATIAVFGSTGKEGMVILAAGFFGSLMDSIIGSKFQPAWTGANGQLRDTGAGPPAKGIPWFGNDLVNFSSNALISGLAAIILL